MKDSFSLFLPFFKENNEVSPEYILHKGISELNLTLIISNIAFYES